MLILCKNALATWKMKYQFGCKYFPPPKSETGLDWQLRSSFFFMGNYFNLNRANILNDKDIHHSTFKKNCSKNLKKFKGYTKIGDHPHSNTLIPIRPSHIMYLHQAWTTHENHLLKHQLIKMSTLPPPSQNIPLPTSTNHHSPIKNIHPRLPTQNIPSLISTHSHRPMKNAQLLSLNRNIQSLTTKSCAPIPSHPKSSIRHVHLPTLTYNVLPPTHINPQLPIKVFQLSSHT